MRWPLLKVSKRLTARFDASKKAGPMSDLFTFFFINFSPPHRQKQVFINSPMNACFLLLFDRLSELEECFAGGAVGELYHQFATRTFPLPLDVAHPGMRANRLV
jgi:hypothetical protein